LGFLVLIFCEFLGLPSMSIAQEDTWTKKADMPTARCALSSSVVNGKIYAIGGGITPTVFPTTEEYNPATNMWTKKTDMPTARTGLSTSVVNDKIYVIGGINHGRQLSTVEEYNPATDTWTKKADMPTPRWGLSTSAVNGKIYAIGGYKLNNANLVGLSTVEEYNPATDTWTKKTDMLTPRATGSASVVNGKIYVVGGYDGQKVLSTVEEYDPATDTWTRKADMPTAKWCCFSSASAVNGKGYFIGGGDDDKVVSTVEEYNPAIYIWTRKADMPTPRANLSTVAVNGFIYAIGGHNDFDQQLSTVEAYDTGFRVVEAKEKLAMMWGRLKSEK